ncbi:hypothetical protein HK102_000335 [Quaeritorhiza haematococci]|nr:hypothetical protein HK102_000335 [Quaeritorhiza haematococci]
MFFHSVPWRAAKASDPHYQNYLQRRHAEGYGFPAFDRLPLQPRLMIYRILEPDTTKRITIPQMVEDPWFKSIEVCHILSKAELEGAGAKDANGETPSSALPVRNSTVSASASSAVWDGEKPVYAPVTHVHTHNPH